MPRRWSAQIDADYFTNPKAQAAGLAGRALHIASICWSAKQTQRGSGSGSDGVVPTAIVPTLVSLAGVNRRAVDALVSSGLWLPLHSDERPNGSPIGFAISGYLDHNPSRERVESERADWRKRQQRYRSVSP